MKGKNCDAWIRAGSALAGPSIAKGAGKTYGAVPTTGPGAVSQARIELSFRTGLPMGSQLLLSFWKSCDCPRCRGQYTVLQQAGRLETDSESASAGTLATSSANSAATAASFLVTCRRNIHPRSHNNTPVPRVYSTARKNRWQRAT
jgi:hypothetical protein